MEFILLYQITDIHKTDYLIFKKPITALRNAAMYDSFSWLWITCKTAFSFLKVSLERFCRQFVDGFVLS
jgi:hypothetical protein